VLMLDTHRTSGRWGQPGMTSAPGLDTGLFIGTDDVILRAKRFSLPGPRVQIQHSPSFFGKVWISRKNPVLVRPGFDGIGAEYPPDGAGTDWLTQRPTRLHGDVCRREPAQRQSSVVDGLTRDGFDESVVQGGKTGPSVLAQGHRPSETPHGPSVASNIAR